MILTRTTILAGGDDNDGDADDSSILDELGLGDDNGAGDDDPASTDPETIKEMIAEAVTPIRDELERERQARTTAEGRLRAERERRSAGDDIEPELDSELSSADRLVLRRQLEQEQANDRRWRRFEKSML